MAAGADVGLAHAIMAWVYGGPFQDSTGRFWICRPDKVPGARLCSQHARFKDLGCEGALHLASWRESTENKARGMSDGYRYIVGCWSALANFRKLKSSDNRAARL